MSSQLTSKQIELRAKIDRRRSKKLSCMEECYNKAYASVNKKLQPIDDPENPQFIDPIARGLPPLGEPLDLCQVCYEMDQPPNKILMQCCCDIYSDVRYCGKWWHPGCVGLKEVPDGDWLCKSCTNAQLHTLNLTEAVGDEGTELVDEESDEESMDEETSKRAVINTATDEVTFPPDPEAEDPELMSNNGDEDESGLKDEEFFPHGSEDDNDNDEEHESSEEDYKTKDKASKKRKTSRAEDEDEDEDFKQQGEKRQKKRAQLKWVARRAGTHPETARQQMDNSVRIKMKAVANQMEGLQVQSLPFTRTDAYNPDDTTMDDQAANEAHYPWVVHGAACITNMATNGNGNGEAKFLKKPIFRLWTGSKQAKDWVQTMFDSIKEAPFDVECYSDRDSYLDAFKAAKK